MKCIDVYSHICDNLDRRLHSPQCQEIRRHLTVCPNCRAYLQSLKRTVKMYKSVPEPFLPRPVHLRLMKTLEKLQSHSSSPRRVSGSKRTHR